jgi:hypothetical protein
MGLGTVVVGCWGGVTRACSGRRTDGGGFTQAELSESGVLQPEGAYRASLDRAPSASVTGWVWSAVGYATSLVLSPLSPSRAHHLAVAPQGVYVVVPLVEALAKRVHAWVAAQTDRDRLLLQGHSAVADLLREARAGATQSATRALTCAARPPTHPTHTLAHTRSFPPPLPPSYTPRASWRARTWR